MRHATQTRPSGCITDLDFDAQVAGELDATARVTLERHLAGCTRCQTRLAELTEEREAFLAERPTLEPQRTPLRRRITAIGAAALGLAAALALWVGPPRPDPANTVRIKGGPRISFYVQREAAAERGSESAKVAPFDQIRFVYSSSRATYLAVFGLDARGVASVYYPDGDQAAAAPAGTERVLETAVVLDGVLGAEDVFAMFCDAPFALEPVRANLARERALEPGAGCRLDRLRWNKEASR